MWILSEHLGWLLCAQALAGVCWGAYELGFFLLFFDSIPENERTGVLTLYNLGNTVTWVLGSATGGVLLYSLGTDRFGYLLLFGISSIGRLLALPLLKGVSSASSPPCAIAVRTVGVRPMDASVDAPVLPSLPDQMSSASQEHLPANGIRDDRTAGISDIVEIGQCGSCTPGAGHGRHGEQEPSTRSAETTPIPSTTSLPNPCALNGSIGLNQVPIEAALADIRTWEQTHVG
jgi:hypothetical protein